MFRAAGPLKHAGDRFQPGLSTLLAPLAGVTKSTLNPCPENTGLNEAPDMLIRSM